ncbi:hypothetical protein H5T53_06790 [Candidatus Bipolaricaulota bacterium]|nr:hypothetical protein [Candidatus Bipolaricaulota bacterium]
MARVGGGTVDSFVKGLETFANLAVSCGVLFFLLEWRRRSRELGYSTYIALSQTSVDLEKLLIDHPEIISVLSGQATLEQVPSARYYFNMLMIIFENVFLCRSRRWLGKDEWDGWQTWMAGMMKLDSFRKTWDEEKSLYARSFAKFMDQFRP